MVINRQSLNTIIVSLSVLSVFQIAPVKLQAQALEEIIVTAQRREQSLQEVPISIEAFTGAEVQQWGHRNMDELANFSPTITVDPDILRSSITIRGFGAASADALTIEQSSPTFVDGIHYGRTSQIKLAFLDLQSIEVLKGPQPVYFGQNAIAGAFNLTTRKPTPEWEGYVDTELSNNSTQKAEFGIGGPISDTLGIRVAGLYEHSSGYLKDIIDGDKFPNYEGFGGRVILQWTPMENFQATLKAELSDINKGSEGRPICFVPGQVVESPGGLFAPQAVLLDPPAGVGWNVEHTPVPRCGAEYRKNLAIQQPDGSLVPPTTIYERTRTILLHTPPSVAALIPRPSSADGFREDRKPYSFDSRENIEPWNLYLNLEYTMDNGISITSLTGYDYYYREYLRDNRGTPFFANFQNREEDQYSFSQELRITSPLGGMFEWMVGGYYQDVDYDIFSDSIRPNTRAPRRYNEGYEDAEWKSVFATVTYNFMGDKASIDVGGRYQNSKKETHIRGYVAEWIQSDGTVIPYNTRINPTTNAGLMIYQSDVPIGMTDLFELPSRVEGPHTGTADQTELNPQITLRFRPTPEHTLYAKYAESFKAAGFNTGQATIPTAEAYAFGPEFADAWEVGGKGTFLDGRARYAVTAFFQKITDLQLAESQANPDNALLNFNNAGEQQNKGIEFILDWIPIDNWTLSLSGAIVDGVMKDYVGAACTDFELEFFEQTGCDADTETIDRSGTQAPNTPDWKFVISSRYTYPLPMLDGYEITANAKGYMSDGYFTDTNGFSQINSFETHGDLNLSLDFGPSDGPWQVSAFVRNLLEPRETYHPEQDFDDDNALRSPTANRNDFTSWGFKFRYDYD